MKTPNKKPTARTVGEVEGSAEQPTERFYIVNEWTGPRGLQHYKDRRPTWIKLPRRLLDDADFAALPVESRALLPLVWLIAADNMDGSLPSLQKIAWRLRMSVADLSRALRPLIRPGAGFLTCLQAASAPLAPDASGSLSLVEKRREETEKSRGEKKGKVSEVECPSCSAVGFLIHSRGKNGHAPGFWCRDTGGCGTNFPIDFEPLLSRLTPEAGKVFQSMATTEAVKADPVADGFKRVRERGMILEGNPR